jgi:hypothetical protein
MPGQAADFAADPGAAFLGRHWRPEALVAHGRAAIGEPAEEKRPPRCFRRNEVSFRMWDFVYVLIAVLFFVGCWAFTRACERL